MVGKVLRLIPDTIDILNNEDEVMEIFMKMVKKSSATKRTKGFSSSDEERWQNEKGFGESSRADSFGHAMNKGGYRVEKPKPGFAGLRADRESLNYGHKDFSFKLGDEKSSNLESTQNGRKKGMVDKGKSFEDIFQEQPKSEKNIQLKT